MAREVFLVIFLSFYFLFLDHGPVSARPERRLDHDAGGEQRPASALPPDPPNFSWDTVPLFMHAANTTGPLNDTAAAYMARFPLVTVEKTQASLADPRRKHQEMKIMAACEKVKSFNASARTLFYLNTIINFPQYDLADKFFAQEDLLLHDSMGKLANITLHGGGSFTVFDLSSQTARDLWLSTINDVLSKSNIDGVFADRGRASAEVDLRKINLTTAKRSVWDEGHNMLIRELMMLVQKLRPKTGIVIPNGADIDGVNGRMFENFSPNDSKSVPPNNDILALQEEEEAGRISEVHKDGCPPGSGAHAPMEFNVSLAAYLVGAVPYSYYGCTEGWSLQTGWMEFRKEYSKPLGEPLAKGKKTEGTWTRKFSKGTQVWLDEKEGQWERPCIHWGDGTWTGAGEDCKRHLRRETMLMRSQRAKRKRTLWKI